MKYIDADKLRAEIVRRITDNTFGAKLELMDILSFLDTLEEPVSDCHDLEEAAEAYSRQVSRGHNYRDLTCGFIAGAKWQKEQETREMIMSDGSYFQKCYELGKKDMKEQMIEGAVECVVCAGMEGDKWIMTYIGSYESMLKTCKAGDKVKIIIVKEEE